MNRDPNHDTAAGRPDDRSRPDGESDERRIDRLPDGEQPLAEDESEQGGIEGAVGGGQSGQGGG